VRYEVLGPREVAVSPAAADGPQVRQPRLIAGTKVMPTYPEQARKQGLEGRVIIEARIGEDGHVHDTRVLKIEPEDYEPFAASAREAVRQWRYEPATAAGRPVEVLFTIVVQFSLNGAKPGPGGGPAI